MKKTTALMLIVAAFAIGIAVAAYAQITYVTVSVKYDNTTQVPALGNVTAWVYAWHQVADSRGIAHGDCDAACRRQIMGEQMRAEFNKWLYSRISATNTASASATTAAQIEALQGVVE